MRAIFAAIIMFALVPVMTVATTTDASAQACRQKCNDEGIACLKRTNNKSQCGDKAKTCAASCR